MRQRRTALRAALALPFALLAACASRHPQPDATGRVWTGRLSLRIDGDPPQALSAGFELRGDPREGELSLLSPLGQVLALVRWQPNRAMLATGAETQQFESLQSLARALGARLAGARVAPAHGTRDDGDGAGVVLLPLAAMFAWLGGTPTTDAQDAAGWELDDSRRADGRLTARRRDPSVELRLILDP